MKKFLTIILTFTLFFGLLTACGEEPAPAGDNNSAGSDNSSSASDKKKSSGKTLTIANDADAISLDPMGSNDNASSKVNLQIYEGLFDISGEGEVIPLLAESYEVEDDIKYTFKLKEGVKFHNGEEMKASDVVFSLKRACNSPNVLHLFNTIDEDTITAESDYVVSMKLKEPFAGILSAFMHPGGSILSEKAVTEAEKDGGTYGQEPVGTGPFKLDKWSKANAIELSAFEDYHGDAPGVDKVIFRIIPEPTNRVIEIESGGADIAFEIQPIDIGKIEDNPDLELYQALDYGTTYLGFNTQKEPFDNPKVREAISYAIDMQSIVDKVWLGVGQCATNSLPPTLKYSIADEYEPRKRDVEKAKQLLEEAGWGDGFECEIATNERKQRVDMATIIKEQLSEVGITANVEVMEWSAYNDHLKNGRQDMFEIAWIADTPDPDTFLFPCFHSSAKGEGGNYCFLEDDELDGYLEEARKELDDDKRAELYRKAQERIHDITAWIPQYNQEITVGATKKVKGLELNPFGYFKLNKITIED